MVRGDKIYEDVVPRRKALLTMLLHGLKVTVAEGGNSR